MSHEQWDPGYVFGTIIAIGLIVLYGKWVNKPPKGGNEG